MSRSRPAAPPSGPITSAEYRHLFESGTLGDGRHLELLAGEIHEAAAIGGSHARCVRRLTQMLHDRLAGRAILSVQNPIALDERSEPEPDLALLTWRDDFYPEHPRPEDVLLLIEVSETSRGPDQEVKRPLYAAAGIPEVWIVDLTGRTLDTWRKPRGGQFQKHDVLRRGDLVSPARFPDVALDVDAILGPAGPPVPACD